MDWSSVDYLWIIVMYLSAVWTLILTAPIHCRASIAFSKLIWLLWITSVVYCKQIQALANLNSGTSMIQFPATACDWALKQHWFLSTTSLQNARTDIHLQLSKRLLSSSWINFWRLKNLKTTVFQQFTKWQYSSSSFSTLDLYQCKPNKCFKCNAMTFKHFKVCRKRLKYTLAHWVTCIQAVHTHIYIGRWGYLKRSSLWGSFSEPQTSTVNCKSHTLDPDQRLNTQTERAKPLPGPHSGKFQHEIVHCYNISLMWVNN